MAWAQTLLDAVPGLVRTVLLLLVIVIPLSVAVELVKARGIFGRRTGGGRWTRRVSRLLGVSEPAIMPLAAGFLLGLAYGAGVILQYSEDGEVSYRDRVLVVLFLVACHAVIEDTLIFLPLGVNPLFLFVSRFVLAVLLTAGAARLWPASASSAGLPAARGETAE